MSSEKPSHVPDGYQSVTPYLTVNGAGALVEFLKKTFDAVEGPHVMRAADGSIKHAEIMIGGSMLMIGEGAIGMPTMRSMLYVYVEDADATYKRALEAGAKSLMPPVDKAYGDRNAAVEDPSGNQWFIGCRKENLTPEEMEKRTAAAS